MTGVIDLPDPLLPWASETCGYDAAYFSFVNGGRHWLHLFDRALLVRLLQIGHLVL